ncbi:HD domain-containing protein [Sandaracinobacter sp. RS1-74]|uniref:HD domain-containing protein n=1 Tax=Sandaracinobacteroides sayramensis TaxID=2913411 RepID=UPI001EDB59EF|nr:HD domain-containing protein [Sandaracinobacteroides sayramensis]MCG2841059.1 HD domain-containing protein [Sandaracinobacteroides sayramensis]
MTGDKDDIVPRAELFATQAHACQQRKYTGEPYIVHPIEVGRLVREAGGTDAMVAAALLHDVVEDCGVRLEELSELFGGEVAALVGWLTDVSKPEDGNRAVRKAMDRAHIALAPADAQTVKLADLISNSSTIMEYGGGFARVYIREKALLLEVLTRGDRGLWQRAKAIVDKALGSGEPDVEKTLVSETDGGRDRD